MNQLSSQFLYYKRNQYALLLSHRTFDCHSSHLFKSFQIIKFFDLVTFHIAIFMYKFQNHLLPATFHSYFTNVTNVHSYNTRLTSKQSYYIPYV